IPSEEPFQSLSELFFRKLLSLNSNKILASYKVAVRACGSDDGFTYKKATIAIDTSALVANYGEASSDGNRDRLRRLFAHEYTHLLHKAWLDQYPLSLATPLERALWECLYEGMGNY